MVDSQLTSDKLGITTPTIIEHLNNINRLCNVETRSECSRIIENNIYRSTSLLFMVMDDVINNEINNLYI